MALLEALDIISRSDNFDPPARQEIAFAAAEALGRRPDSIMRTEIAREKREAAVASALWHRLLRGPGGAVSENGRLRQGTGVTQGGDRRRSVLMLTILSTRVGDIERIVDPVRARQEGARAIEMAQDPSIPETNRRGRSHRSGARRSAVSSAASEHPTTLAQARARLDARPQACFEGIRRAGRGR